MKAENQQGRRGRDHTEDVKNVQVFFFTRFSVSSSQLLSHSFFSFHIKKKKKTKAQNPQETGIHARTHARIFMHFHAHSNPSQLS